MLPQMFSLKAGAIAVGVAFLVGGVTGARVQKKIDNAAYFSAVAKAKQARIEELEKQLAARDAAAKADAARAGADTLERRTLEGKGRDLESKSGDRVCFDDAAAGRLRELWHQSAGGTKAPPAARPR